MLMRSIIFLSILVFLASSQVAGPAARDERTVIPSPNSANPAVPGGMEVSPGFMVGGMSGGEGGQEGGEGRIGVLPWSPWQPETQQPQRSELKLGEDLGSKLIEFLNKLPSQESENRTRSESDFLQLLKSQEVCLCNSNSSRCSKCPHDFSCDGCTCVAQTPELRLPRRDSKTKLPFPLPDPTNYNDIWAHTLACHLLITGKIARGDTKCSTDPAKVLYAAHCLRYIIPIWRSARAIDVSERPCMLIFPHLYTNAQFERDGGRGRGFEEDRYRRFRDREGELREEYLEGNRYFPPRHFDAPYEPYVRSGFPSPRRDFREAYGEVQNVFQDPNIDQTQGQDQQPKPDQGQQTPQPGQDKTQEQPNQDTPGEDPKKSDIASQEVFDNLSKRNFVSLVFKDMLNQTTPEETQYLEKWQAVAVGQIAAFGLFCHVGYNIPQIF